jgi:hypothetical protein
MKYTVAWRPSAVRTLAEIWTRSDDREAVRKAADSIDALLRFDPLEAGSLAGIGHGF